MEGADDKVHVHLGEHGVGVLRRALAAAQLHAHADLQGMLVKGGPCLGHLLHNAGPVVVQDQAVPHLPDQVPVVGDAQLGQAGVHRGLGHGGEGVLPVRRAEGVGVIVGEIHSASR